ncbi:MAG: toll/interleukin-1 receptor domain-containing protein, partial [Pseudonocardiaceae bacterium]
MVIANVGISFAMTAPSTPFDDSDAELRTVKRPALRVFVSYSRRDFNFAEALTVTFRQNTALDPWLDVQRLRPGIDWAKALDENLDRADVLLLVASPAALASTFVRREWSRALGRGIPVYIGVVKAVRLPNELARCPGNDLRVRFWRRAAELGRAVAARDITSSTITSRPRRWWLPGRVPVPLAVLVALSMVNSLALLWATVLLLRFATGFARSGRAFTTPIGLIESKSVGLSMLQTPILAASFAIYVVVVPARLLLRRSTLRMLGVSFGGPFLFGVSFFVSREEDTLRLIQQIVDVPGNSPYMLRILT